MACVSDGSIPLPGRDLLIDLLMILRGVGLQTGENLEGGPKLCTTAGGWEANKIIRSSYSSTSRQYPVDNIQLRRAFLQEADLS